MLYIILILSFIAGIFIHFTVIHLPCYLHRSWKGECIAYLQDLNYSVAAKANATPLPLLKKKLRHYLPFFSLRLLGTDIALLVSSLIIFYHFNTYLEWGSCLLFTWLLIANSTIDFEHQILPDQISYTILWLGLACSCLNIHTSPFVAISGAIIAYLFLFTVSHLFKLIRKKDGLGQGDTKLFAAIATWTGVSTLPLILLIACLCALLFILLRKLFYGEKYSMPAAFGPYLAFAGWLILLWGDKAQSILAG